MPEPGGNRLVEGHRARLALRLVAPILPHCPSRLHHTAAHVRPVIMRIGRDQRPSLPGCRWGTSAEDQFDEKHGEPTMQVYCTATGSIRLGSLFLTLPTRVLTGQHVIFAEG